MGNGPDRGKSWGRGCADWPGKCRLEHRIACHREAPGRERKGPFGQSERHQGGRKGQFGQPERHQGGRKGFIGQLARHQGGRNGSIGQLARHQGGTREAGKNHLDGLGDTREAPERQERHQGDRKGPIGQPARHQEAFLGPLVAQDWLERPSHSTGLPRKALS